MKVFISQPMYGLSDKQILDIRDGIKLFLEQNGFEVIDSFLKDDDKNRIEMLGKSIELLGQADYIYLSKGWENSKGCRIECEVAREYGIPVVKNLESFILKRFEEN